MDTQNTTAARPTVDYLTITTKEDPATATLLSTLLDRLGSDFIYHSRKRPWAFQGYHGQAYEGVRYGLRGEQGIVMLSGAHAASLWRAVAPLRQNCTRVDLAVTVTLASADHDVAVNAYKRALESWGGTSANVINSRGGATTYIGSRQSRFFGRLYDKGAEQADMAGEIWRYEVEIKKPASEMAITRLLAEKNPATFINDFVYGWFVRHGITPLFDAANAESVIEIGAKVKSSDKTLEWLSTQVRPAVGRLIIEGREAELLEALGLPDYVKRLQFELKDGE